MNRKVIYKTVAGFVVGIILSVAMVLSVPLFRNSEVYATETVSAEELYKNALVAGLQTCYSSTYMNSNVNASGVTISKVLTSAGKSDGKVVVPTYVGNTLKDSDMSCEDILSGYSGSGGVAKSIFSAFGKPAFSSSATGTNLVSLGYTPVASENAAPTGNYEVKVSFDYFKITNGSAGEKKNGYYVVTIDSNGAEVSSTANSCYSYSTTSAWPCVSAVPNSFWVQDGQLYGQIIVHGAFNGMYPDIGNGISIVLFGTNDVDFTYTGAITCDGYYSDEQNVAYSCGSDGTIYKLSNFDVKVTFKPDESQVTSSAKYEITNFTSARAKLRLYLEASSYGTFKAADKKSLYYNNYILSVLKDSTNGATYVDNSDCLDSLTSEIQNSSSDYYLPSNGKWCRLVGSENATVKKNPADNDYKFAIIGSSTSMKKTSGTKAAAFQEVVKELMKISNSIDITDTNDIGQEVNDATTPDPGNNGGDNNDGDAGIFDGCISNAGVLGWIICPVTRIVGEAVQGIYTDIANNYLTMKSATMTSSSLRGAWSQFQGYANILFAILLVIVILSQVTGIGLSNYGIKKVLPRLIITIVLVNLSFILCSVAVDLSNILGVSLDDLFSNMDVGGVIADDLNLGTIVGNTLTSLAGATTSVAVGAGIISVVIATEAWKFMILPLLLTLLTAFIGIIFFYVILGVRQAAIVLLVAISPIAVVCYALPNTQKLFNRWLKIFADLLMVFPICGILMGGGNFASRLLLTAGGDVPFMYFLIAMLLSVVPFFFIPTILKGSMTAMGNLGMKISNMGSRLGSWSDRTIRGTRAFQDHQQEALRESNMARDKGIMDRYRNSVKRLSAKEKDGTITKREQQQLNRARYRLNRASGRRERAIMEDLQASVNATREELEPGTERYKTTRDRLARRQAAEEARGLTELYDAGIASKIDGSGKLDTSDEDAVVAELDAIMSKLDADPEDNDALAKMQALSSSMMGKGEFGENVIRSALERHVAGQIRGGRYQADRNSGLRQLSNFISSGPLGGRLKSDDRDTFDMATALAKGDKYYSDPDGFRKDFGVDASGSIVHNKFAHGSAGKLSARGLADSNDAVLDRIEAAVSSGDISGTELNTLMKNVDEALNNDTIQLKTGVRKKLENIAHQAYTKSGGTATTRTANSTSASIMANSSTNTLDAMLSRVQNYSSLSPAERTAQADELRVMAENAKYALENDIVKDTATAERLQNIVEAVRSQGISDFAGNTGGNSFKLNTGSFKIRGIQAEQHASVPTGWKQNPTAPGGYTVETSPGHYRPLNTQELEHLKEIQAFNRQVDMRNSSKGLKGSDPAGSP